MQRSLKQSEEDL